MFYACLVEQKKKKNEIRIKSSLDVQAPVAAEHIVRMDSSKIHANSLISFRTSKKLARMPVAALCWIDDQAKGGRKRGPLDGVAEIKKKKKVDDKEGKNEKKHLDAG